MPKVSDSHLAARRQQILQATQNCIARKGLKAISMQDIFDESGLSPGAVYRYFKGKQEIINATLECGSKAAADGFAQMQQSLDPGLALDEFARLSFGRIGDPAALSSLRSSVEFLVEATQNEEIRGHYRTMAEALIGALESAVRGMQKSGQAPSSLAPPYMGRVLYALYEGCITQKLIFPELDVDRFVDTMTASLVFKKGTAHEAASPKGGAPRSRSKRSSSPKAKPRR